MTNYNNSAVYTNRKSKKNNVSEVRAAIYCRLSKDDNLDGESESIQNQKLLLTDYCRGHNWNIVGVYEDDGISGLKMETRPGLQRMLNDIRMGKIDLVITKDTSRLARNYLDFGHLFEEFFPKYRVRYIGLNDGVDTERGNDFVPIRAYFNEHYCKDLSGKVHSSYMVKAKEGQFTGCIAPFGYRKDPADKNHLIIDEDTAWIVRKIFAYAADGKGPNYIRRKLEDEQIPCPTWWNRQKGLRNIYSKFEKIDPENGRFIWDFTTIQDILANPVYIGTIASQKSEYKFKVGWLGEKAPEDWITVENMHEPIIDRETYELVQDKVKSRKRPDAWGNYSIFAGLVKCGQCGSSLNIRRANQKGNDRIYTCSRYNRYGVKHCSQHRIKYDVLYNIVLEQIRGYARAALADEEAVAEELRRNTESEDFAEREIVQKSVAADTERIRELDHIIGRLYEDMVSGKLNEDTFNTILSQKQTEQEMLKKRVELNSVRLEEQEREASDNARFLEMIKEYADIQELDGLMLNRLIQMIVIHEDITEDAIHQTVEIHWNFKGTSEKLHMERGRI